MTNPTPTLVDLADLSKSFTLDAFGDEIRSNFVDSAEGMSNGIGYRLVPQEGDLVFVPFSNVDDTQAFNDLPTPHPSIHVASHVTVTFDAPVTFLLVATANDNDSGDGFDFGIVPSAAVDIEVEGTFMQSLDRSGTLALLTAEAPTSIWVSDSDDGDDDGIDLAFFAYPDVTATATDGRDLLAGSGGRDRLDGLAGDDWIGGGDGRDRLTGGEGDDVIVGGDGVDILIAGGGTDTMEGGDARDFFVLRPAEGPVTMRDFDPDQGDKLVFDDRFFGVGDDAIDLRDVTEGQAAFALRTGRIEYDRATGELWVDGDGDARPDAAVLVAVLEGGPGFDSGDVLVF